MQNYFCDYINEFIILVYLKNQKFYFQFNFISIYLNYQVDLPNHNYAIYTNISFH